MEEKRIMQDWMKRKESCEEQGLGCYLTGRSLWWKASEDYRNRSDETVLDTKQYWEKQNTNASVSLPLSLSLSQTHKYTLILISNTGILAGENLNKCTHSAQENKSALWLFIMLIKFTHWNINRFQRPHITMARIYILWIMPIAHHPSCCRGY